MPKPGGPGGLDIERRPDGSYAVERPGAKRTRAVEPTQGKAIERAKEIEPGVKPRVQRVRHTTQGKPGPWRKE